MKKCQRSLHFDSQQLPHVHAEMSWKGEKSVAFAEFAPGNRTAERKKNSHKYQAENAKP